MRDVFMTGRSAALYLLSSEMKRCDAEFELACQIRGSESNFMAYLDDLAERPCSVHLADRSPSVGRFELQELWQELRIDAPLEVAVASQALRRSSNRLSCQVHPTCIPTNMYFEIGGGLYCSFPESALAMEAPRASKIDLVVLMSLMFGIFASDRRCQGKLVPRRKLSCPECMARFLDMVRNDNAMSFRGAVCLGEMLPYTVPNAASPAEIESALRLSLPIELGGCGFPKPCMNYALSIPGSYRKRYCDLYWPSHNVAIEYDGEWEHGSSGAHAADALHRNDLAALHVAQFTLEKNQMNDLEKFNRVASQVRKSLSLPDLPKSRAFFDAQVSLKAAIRGAFKRYGF